jgi:glutamyl-tRNA synthetase
LTSTPKHIQLYEIFKHQAPLFVHLPNINGSNGKKLSKRDKANSATYYQ